MLRISRSRIDIALDIIIRSLFVYYIFITTLFFFDDDLNFENNLYIIKYVMIVIMIMSKIILRESVKNNNNQLYPANDLAIIVSTFVLRSCYYSLMKLIQSFVSHYSTFIIKKSYKRCASTEIKITKLIKSFVYIFFVKRLCNIYAC